MIILVQPSSAAAERVFSVLQSFNKSQQESSLEDYVEELPVMLLVRGIFECYDCMNAITLWSKSVSLKQNG